MPEFVPNRKPSCAPRAHRRKADQDVIVQRQKVSDLETVLKSRFEVPGPVLREVVLEATGRQVIGSSCWDPRPPRSCWGLLRCISIGSSIPLDSRSAPSWCQQQAAYGGPNSPDLSRPPKFKVEGTGVARGSLRLAST